MPFLMNSSPALMYLRALCPETARLTEKRTAEIISTLRLIVLVLNFTDGQSYKHFLNIRHLPLTGNVIPHLQNARLIAVQLSRFHFRKRISNAGPEVLFTGKSSCFIPFPGSHKCLDNLRSSLHK